MIARPAFAPARIRRWILPTLALLLLMAWQGGIIADRRHLDRFPLPSVSGLRFPSRAFLYFLYYTGYHPVSSVLELAYSREDAWKTILDRGESLRMTPLDGYAMGDMGQVFLYLPYAWYRGSPRFTDPRPVHTTAFLLALAALLVGFWRSGRLLFGIVFVLLLGSHGFQLFHAYKLKNVWSWPVTASLLLLALHLPVIFRPERLARGAPWTIAASSGAFLGVLAHIRGEPVASIVAVAALYALTAAWPWRKRLALIGLAVAALLGVRQAGVAYFENRISAAQRLVSSVGGAPYHGPRNVLRPLWHDVYIGFGDFDRKYGIRWDDRIAQAYAKPILKERHGIELFMPAGKGWRPFRSAYHENGRTYPIRPELLPEYNRVIRSRVLNLIGSDPGWFAGILSRRLVKILNEAPPLSFQWGHGNVAFATTGWLVVPAILFAFYLRSRWFLKVLLFTLPPSLIALLVYSGRGAVHYSIFQFAAGAFLIALLVSAGIRAGRTVRRLIETPPSPSRQT